MAATDKVRVTLARNRAYIKWPYDHHFMKLFEDLIPFGSSRHFYRDGKYWHINQNWWEQAYRLFQSHYMDIEISGSFEDNDAPVYDEDFPEDDDIIWDFDSDTSITSTDDAYRVLHLLPTANATDAKVMYKHLSHHYHPDVDGGDEGMMKAVNAAYEYIEANDW